ncbi:MAG: hypothetical protein IKG93_12310 [Clostridiales bacterium]|nr:hypothetical protein [Clostridiales bacterium]
MDNEELEEENYDNYEEPEIEEDSIPEQESESDELSKGDSWWEKALFSVLGFFAFLGHTTWNFFKALPGNISSKIKEKIAQKKRMPKRKSIHKVYVLVGYTTKEYVNRKYRKERALLIIRRILVACIILVILIMAYRWFVPQLDTDEYKQMIGIDDIKELTQSDPFATETTKAQIQLESEAITPIPSDTSLTVATTSNS